MAFLKIINFRFPTALALIAAASPDLEKEGFFSSLSFLNREYSGQREIASEINPYSAFGNALNPILYKVKAWISTFS